jgi:hypothetical protein
MTSLDQTAIPNDDRRARALRALITISVGRLSCFSEAYSTSRPREPKDPEFLKKLVAARETNEFSDGLLEQVEMALRRHFWNTALCAALFPATHTAEVLFRNAFGAAFEALTGVERWLLDLPKAADLPVIPAEGARVKRLASIMQNDRLRDRIDEATKAVRNKYTWDERDKTPSQSQLVAELDLGFWVILLQSITTDDWEAMRAHVFPFRPGTSKEQASTLLQSLRILRNSMAHAHPLWAGAERERPLSHSTSEDNAPLNYIRSRHDDVFALIRGINQEVAKLLERRDIFERLLHTDLSEFSVL